MNARDNLKKQLIELEILLDDLRQREDFTAKLTVLNKFPNVIAFVDQSGPIQSFMKTLSPESEYVLKSVAALGQADIVFNAQDIEGVEFSKRVLTLLEQLLDVEEFYTHLGGVIGYHATFLKLLLEHELPPSKNLDENISFIHPEGLHLEEDKKEIRQSVRVGIENIPHLAMIFPIGGAGDRLDLRDDQTGNPLPAALLPFLGRSLLEGMIRDVQASEYLSFKISQKKSITPIAIMTSVEKNNHVHILNICKALKWFGRSSESFLFFIQPQVPVITRGGNWSLLDILTLNIKPSGHGVVWKLAEERGVFSWFKKENRQQCIVRQINNPIGGTDYALLALNGIGCGKQKAFGFLSCERPLNSDEGTNVLIETKSSKGYDYCLTNIEYTDFAKRGIGEVPAKPGSNISLYPTNTNILFANISSIKEALNHQLIPGQLINLKSDVPYIDPQGNKFQLPGGRLESTMQNIADSIVDHFPQKLREQECADNLRTFILYNSRTKTISTTKKRYCPGKTSISTPEQAFYDLLTNHYSLLKDCQFELPRWKNFKEHLEEGPSCIFIFHPAMGPLFSIIAQKIRKGVFAEGAELQLEIAEVDIENISLEGSLIVESSAPMGTLENGSLHYEGESRICLKRVVVSNRGIDKNAPQQYWKNEINRHEEVRIILHEGSEFQAEDVSLMGSHCFEVPPYQKLSLSQGVDGKLNQKLTSIETSSWHWKYQFDSQDRVILKKNSGRARKTVNHRLIPFRKNKEVF